jgi:hypothetical protein
MIAFPARLHAAHEFICARFRGDVLPSLRMAAASRGKTQRSGTEIIREMMRVRLALVACGAGVHRIGRWARIHHGLAGGAVPAGCGDAGCMPCLVRPGAMWPGPSSLRGGFGFHGGSGQSGERSGLTCVCACHASGTLRTGETPAADPPKRNAPFARRRPPRRGHRGPLPCRERGRCPRSCATRLRARGKPPPRAIPGPGRPAAER